MRVKQIYFIKCTLLNFIFMAESQMKKKNIFYSTDISFQDSLHVVKTAEKQYFHSINTRV